jgi:predicted transcriptional regulator
VVKYRPAIKIVLKILECIAKNEAKGRVLKTHVVQCANLKTTSGEKYLDMLRDAGYLVEKKEAWGERIVITYEMTPLGKERYEWFTRINLELFETSDWIKD